jgi:DNA-binding MarR family transcriptional regulator
MSEIAAKLAAKGLVARGRAKSDRRKILLSLTEEGRIWLTRQDEDHVRRRRAELFSALTPEEQRTLGVLLDKLCVDWEERFEHSQTAHGAVRR